jgi:hypothetical protein
MLMPLAQFMSFPFISIFALFSLFLFSHRIIIIIIISVSPLLLMVEAFVVAMKKVGRALMLLIFIHAMAGDGNQ